MELTPRVKEILSWYGSDNPGTLANLARLVASGLGALLGWLGQLGLFYLLGGLLPATVPGGGFMPALAGIATSATYMLVLVAYKYAPVGYVNALRESSVLIVAVIGWRVLHEKAGRRRLVAASTVVGGLVLLIVGH